MLSNLTPCLLNHKNILTSPIAHLIVFKHSSFPDDWTCAIVMPIFKSGDRLAASNYRPISILPVLSKVVEKVVIKQLTTCLNTSNCMQYGMQFGFRANHSTKTATLYLIEQIKLLDKDLTKEE